jgi:glycosyltransferase involved in cell wall biosynthesis
MDKKTTLSVILIANNESANILDCLASVGFADQIIVVDSGSTDNTVELARSVGAHVVQTTDWPGFGAQKNRALDLATCDWVFSIDADERVTPELAEQLKAAIKNDIKNDSKGNNSIGQHDAYEIPRLTQFCGQWIRHCGWTPDHVLRLFKRGSARFSNDLVHERAKTRSIQPGVGQAAVFGGAADQHVAGGAVRCGGVCKDLFFEIGVFRWCFGFCGVHHAGPICVWQVFHLVLFKFKK